MPNQDPKDEIPALAIRSAQELTTRSSLVSRGLREIANGFQEDPIFFAVYDNNNGWHVIKEDDIQWEPVDDGRERRQRPLQTCFGPFFSNHDPNEGPVGSGRELAEALCEEKRKLYPNGPVLGRQGS